MTTIRLERVRYLSIIRYETDSDIPDAWFNEPPLVALEKLGWMRLVKQFFVDQMTEWCANDCVTVTRNGECGYTVTVEVAE